MENVQNATVGEADEFTPEQFAELDKWIAQYKGKTGSVIRALNKAQEIFGYLPREVQDRVAKGIGRPLSEVYGIVTFYSFFNLVPKGKHSVCACMGTACYVRGGQQVLDDLKKDTEHRSRRNDCGQGILSGFYSLHGRLRPCPGRPCGRRRPSSGDTQEGKGIAG